MLLQGTHVFDGQIRNAMIFETEDPEDLYFHLKTLKRSYFCTAESHTCFLCKQPFR